MATDNKIPAYVLTQKQINQIAFISSREGVKAFKEEQKKETKRQAKREDKVEITKRKLKEYRTVKERLKEEIFSADEIEEMTFEYLEELMGKTKSAEGKIEKKIEAEEWKRVLDNDTIRKIDAAYAKYKNKCEKYGNNEAKRRCRELYMMYLDEKIYTTQEIACIENISDKTVYKDLGIACRMLATYLYGF